MRKLGYNNAGAGKGFEVYVQTAPKLAAKSKALAKAIEEQVKEIGQNSRGIKTRLNSQEKDYFGWLRQLTCPAVLCEGAFLDNDQDYAMIDTEAKQRAFGVAYAWGVQEYLGVASKPESGLTAIMGRAEATAAQMGAFLRGKNSDAPDYASIYLEEGSREGVRGDIAFAQACLETGYWRFGGDVKSEQNNFCGLGTTGKGEPGLSFVAPELGIRAQIQPLKAYASTEPLVGDCVDPRFPYV